MSAIETVRRVTAGTLAAVDRPNTRVKITPNGDTFRIISTDSNWNEKTVTLTIENVETKEIHVLDISDEIRFIVL